MKQIAELMQGTIRRADVLCRYGGDEFAIICRNRGFRSGCHGRTIRKTSATPTSAKTIAAVLPPLVVESVFARRHAGNDELLSQADNALYEAKQREENQICVYSLARAL